MDRQNDIHTPHGKGAPTPRRWHFSLTQLNILLWGCIVAAVIVAAAFVVRTMQKSTVTIGADDKIDITPTLITSMREIGEWEFLSIDDEELVDTLRKGFFSDDELVRIYYGRLSLGINMKKAEPHWAVQQGDSVILRLPPIELLDNDFIDEARTRAFIERGKWTDADREALYQRAHAKMVRRCLTRQNIATARDNAEQQLSQMMRSMGVEKFRIEWL